MSDKVQGAQTRSTCVSVHARSAQHGTEVQFEFTSHATSLYLKHVHATLCTIAPSTMSPTTVTLKAPDHPIKSVIIFQSSTAELTRTFTVDLQARPLLHILFRPSTRSDLCFSDRLVAMYLKSVASQATSTPILPVSTGLAQTRASSTLPAPSDHSPNARTPKMRRK